MVYKKLKSDFSTMKSWETITQPTPIFSLILVTDCFAVSGNQSQQNRGGINNCLQSLFLSYQTLNPPQFLRKSIHSRRCDSLPILMTPEIRSHSITHLTCIFTKFVLFLKMYPYCLTNWNKIFHRIH